jgi:hypothetical protein
MSEDARRERLRTVQLAVTDANQRLARAYGELLAYASGDNQAKDRAGQLLEEALRGLENAIGQLAAL